MNPADSFALFALLALTFLHAFFTLAETALLTVRNTRLQQMLAEGDARTGTAGGVQTLMRQATRVGATVQVGITLASFAVAALAAATLTPDVAKAFHHWGVPHDTRTAGVALTLLAALFTISVGEIVPRAIALRRPEQVALAVQAPLRLFMLLFGPLASIALGLSNALIRPFGLSATFAAPMITEEELRTVLDAGARSGAIEEDEKQIIRNVISFGDTDVRQVMTPRIDVKAADVGMTLSALLELIVASGHSRIPVYEGSVDSIIGIVHVKDLLPVLARSERTVDLRSVMRVPLLVPENKRVDELLDEFRRSNIQLAIVQDEYGGTAGLATIEDLLEELVGEIKDEYDIHEPDTDRPLLQTLDDHSVLIEGRMNIDDLNEQMGLLLPHEDFDTVGGFVFGLFGHQPVEGEAVRHDDMEFIVERADGRRVQMVRLTRHLPPEEESQE
jgi:putative hemolysin